jgi:F-type H+-transporting ATPase subunit b
MLVLALQTVTEGGGRLEQVALRFGVDWPHLLAQIVSFSIVCLVLYLLAYRPVLRMLAVRREQIAGGIANAERIQRELARIEAERQERLARADAEGRRLLEDARVSAARLQEEMAREAGAAAAEIVAHARDAAVRDRERMLAELKGDIGRLVVETTAAVAGKVLTADDQRRLAEESARLLAA